MSAGLSEADAYSRIYDTEDYSLDTEPYIDLSPRRSRSAKLIAKLLNTKNTGLHEDEVRARLHPPSTPPEAQDMEGIVVLNKEHKTLSPEAIKIIGTITGWSENTGVYDLGKSDNEIPVLDLIDAKRIIKEQAISPKVPELVCDIMDLIEQTIRYTPLDRSVYRKIDPRFNGEDKGMNSVIRQAEEFINTRQGVAAHTKYAARPGDHAHYLVVAW